MTWSSELPPTARAWWGTPGYSTPPWPPWRRWTPARGSGGGCHPERGVSLITADHGNAEHGGRGRQDYRHTNLVPFYIIGAGVTLRDGPFITTMLDLMGLAKPARDDGVTLIEVGSGSKPSGRGPAAQLNNARISVVFILKVK